MFSTIGRTTVILETIREILRIPTTVQIRSSRQPDLSPDPGTDGGVTTTRSLKDRLMKRTSNPRRRPSIHITAARAARLHRFVSTLASGPRARDALLTALGVGLRTFYRELELLKRCGVRIRLDDRSYQLLSTADEAEGRLPFPDPQLSFSEMAELARGSGEAAKRLAQLLDNVIELATAKPARGGRGKRGKAKK
jgi:hypothetical protein